MLLKHSFILLSITVAICCLENYGPYEVLWEKFVTCKGPKQSDCGKLRLENTQNMSDVIFVIDFPKDCPVTKAKVTIGTKQNNSTKKLWNYSLDTPCQHFVLGPILVDAFNLSDNCKINKTMTPARTKSFAFFFITRVSKEWNSSPAYIFTSSCNVGTYYVSSVGHYNIHVNMMEKTTVFLGSSFFYGNYTFKTIAYNKVNNFFCVDAHIRIGKKPVM